MTKKVEVEEEVVDEDLPELVAPDLREPFARTLKRLEEPADEPV